MAARSNRGRPSITLIGAGSLATALGPALLSAGYRIDAVAARKLRGSQKRAATLAKKLGAKAIALGEALPNSSLIWIFHTDDALATTARQLAGQREWIWKNKIVFHSSGALTSDVLAPLKRAGAQVASLHPMMTFVPGTAPDMSKVPFAVEGDARAVAAARKIVRRLGAESFVVKKKNKVLYHALGSFSSPMVVAALVTAERVGRAAGFTREQAREVMGPILHQTLKNYLERGGAAAFSGPIKRGDLETVRRHLRELKRVPGAGEVYRALVRSGVRELPAGRKKELLQLLQKP
jgi:predicted short-subunit dehydrogenase-like oxidoreductase (DUF2520 family)